jgi:SmpA / OmlA family
VFAKIFGKGGVDVTKVIAALVSVLVLASTAALAAGFIVNPDLLDRIKPGMTAQEVEQILGPPRSRSDFSRLGVVSMDYETRILSDTYDIGVMIGKDGIVREVQRIRRYRGG